MHLIYGICQAGLGGGSKAIPNFKLYVCRSSVPPSLVLDDAVSCRSSYLQCARLDIIGDPMHTTDGTAAAATAAAKDRQVAAVVEVEVAEQPGYSAPVGAIGGGACVTHGLPAPALAKRISSDDGSMAHLMKPEAVAYDAEGSLTGEQH